MGKDLYHVSKKLFPLDFNYNDNTRANLALDLSNFDNTVSHCSLYQIMKKTVNKTELSDDLLELHEYDYPFIDRSVKDRSPVIRPISTRLMTGHYLTSAIGTGTQISRYLRWVKEGYDIDVRSVTGDDSSINTKRTDIETIYQL
jgi:hypothetical protein